MGPLQSVAVALFLVLPAGFGVFIPVCSPDTTISRKLEMTGFHRLLSYSVEIVHSGDWDDCTICIEELIPSGLYVNPDEIASLKHPNNISVYFNDLPDIEAPKSLSKAFTAAFCSSLEPDSNLLSAEISVPLHLRYHSARSDGGFDKARLKLPKAFIHCSSQPSCLDMFPKFPCPGKESTKCLFQALNYKMNGKEIELEVPVGKMADFYLVFGVTIMLVYTGAIYIVVGAFMKKND